MTPGDGQLTLSWTGATTYFLYDGGRPLCELDGTGNVTKVSDCYGRSVFYHAGAYATVGSPPNYAQSYQEVDHVSQVVPSTLAAGSAPDRWAYGYQDVGNTEVGEQVPFLHTIAVPSPAGSGTGTVTIAYDPATDFVASITDGNGNSHSYASVDGNHTRVTVKNPGGNTVYTYTGGYDNNLSETTRTDGGNATVVSTYAYADPSDPYRPSGVTDGNGKTWAYTYDQYGNTLTETPPSSGVRTPAATTNTYRYTNFALGELTATQEGTKTPTSYAYAEPSGLVQTVTGPRPGTTGAAAVVTAAYTYDGLGNVLTITAPGPNSTPAASPSDPHYATYVTTTMNYTSDGGYSQADAVGEPLAVTDPLGHATHYRYTETVPYASGAVNRGHATSTTDALGNETDQSYNIDGRPLATLFPATGQSGAGRGSTVSQYLYDEPGDTGGYEQYGPLASAQTFDEGNTSGPFRQVSYAYGPEGETLGASGSTEPVSYTYDALYRLSTLTDGGGHATRYFYNAAGYPYQTAYPGSGATAAPLSAGSYDTVTYTSYDAHGDLLTRVDGNGTTTTYTYADPESLLTNVHYALPASPPATLTALGDTSYAYDAYGRRATMGDAAGGRAYAYDDTDALTSDATTYAGLSTKTVSYSFNPDGSRAAMSVTGVTGSFSYSYDNAGRMTGLTNPAGEGTSWTYGANDWTASQTLADGAATSYTYDARGQQTDLKTTLAGATLSEFAAPSTNGYDGAGNRLSVGVTMAAAGGSPATTGATAYAYDGRDELTGESSTRLGGYSNAFAYDGVTAGTTTGPGNPTIMRGASQAYGTGGDNQLSGTGFAYDGDGNPKGYQGGTLSFDPENRLSGLSPASASAPAVADAGFETPALGSGNYSYPAGIAGTTPTVSGSWTFTSDAGLSSNGSAVTGSQAAPEGTQVAFVQGYNTDPAGVASQSLSGFQFGVSYTLTVSAAQRSGTGGPAVKVLLDGTQIGTVSPSGTSYADYSVGPFTTSAGSHTLSFVATALGAGTNTVDFLDDVRLTASGAADTYGYRGDGLRAYKQVNGGPKTYFLYDGDTPLCQMDGTGNVTAVDTFGPNGLVGQRVTGGGTSTSYFYTWDPSGNLAQRLSSAGNASYAFDAFGLRGVSQTGDPFTGFVGQWGGQTDAETGLTLLTHRYYDAGTGRWLTRDPVGYNGGINLYGYCGNDPVNESDSSGLKRYHGPNGPHPMPPLFPQIPDPLGPRIKRWCNQILSIFRTDAPDAPAETPGRDFPTYGPPGVNRGPGPAGGPPLAPNNPSGTNYGTNNPYPIGGPSYVP